MRITWIFLFLAVLLAGCAGPSAAPGSPTEPTAGPPAAQEPSSHPAVGTARPGGSGPGISYEENLRINPPAVQNLTAAVQADGILLTWDAPPAVSVPHSYSDNILGYRVYRRAQGSVLSDRALLAETDETRYLDASAEPGVEYFYTVTALNERNLESSRADEVSATR